MSSQTFVEQVIGAATPASGRDVIYVKTDGIFYKKNAAGVEAPLGQGALKTGTAILNFGSAPGSGAASAVVTGLSEISSSSVVEVFMMGDTTADHNAFEHQFVPLKLSAGSIVAGTGFTIWGFNPFQLTGQFQVRWALVE